MTKNLYPKLQSAALMSQEVSTLTQLGNIIQTSRILGKNIMKSNENIRILITNYHMNLKVQVLLA